MRLTFGDLGATAQEFRLGLVGADPPSGQGSELKIKTRFAFGEAGLTTLRFFTEQCQFGTCGCDLGLDRGTSFLGTTDIVGGLRASLLSSREALLGERA